MFRWFFQMIYGSTLITFNSSYDLPKSVARLRAVTNISVFSLRQSAVTGVVMEQKVALHRSTPFVGNSFKPYFMGRFSSNNDQVVLIGRFTMHWYVKTFMTIWFGFLSLMIVLVLFATIWQNQPAGWQSALFCVGMFSAGTLLVWSGQRLAHQDIAWLSDVIRKALSEVNPSNENL
jgi:hypothetical protein